MEKELLKFCEYYKGEKDCPFDYDDIRGSFWCMEEQYFALRYEQEHTKWEEYSQTNALTEFPELKDLFTSPKLSIEAKGMLAFSATDIMYHSPMGGVMFLLGYIKKDPVLQYLHYYKEEDSNPFPADEAASQFWSLEQIWFTQVRKDTIVDDGYTNEFLYDFPDMCYPITKDTPISLKAFMYDQYTHMGGSKEGFESYLMNYIQNAKF